MGDKVRTREPRLRAVLGWGEASCLGKMRSGIQANPGRSNQIQPVLVRRGLVTKGARVAGSAGRLELTA